MTPQEAIQQIKTHNEIHSRKEPFAVHITEALQMAFEALEKQTAHEEKLKIRCAEIAEMKCHLSNVLDERSKIGVEFEQALMQIDELKGKIEFLKGQVEAYQYCMNCRR